VARPPAGRSGTDDLKARAVAWVEATCADQGVPVKLSDPLALAKVAEILAQGRQTGIRRDSSKRL
jgi:hypothetical protein